MSSSLKDKALRLLAGREHSRLELQRKLQSFADDKDELSRLLDELEDANFLSEERFIASYIRTRILSGRGKQAIIAELAQRGIASARAALAINECDIDWQQQLRDVWQRKFSVLPANQKEYAKQVRFLVSRGFAYDEIIKLLNK